MSAVSLNNIKNQIKDKAKELMGKVNESNWHYVFGGALLVIFLLNYFIFMYPQLADLAKMNPQIKLFWSDLKKGREDIQKIGEYHKEVKALREKIESTNLMVKPKTEVPLILERISRIANKNRVIIDQIKPLTTESREVLQNGDFQYSSLPILVELTTGYHELGKFINEIEKDGIFFRVSDFVVVSTADLNKHDIQLTIQTMVFEKVEEKDPESKDSKDKNSKGKGKGKASKGKATKK